MIFRKMLAITTSAVILVGTFSIAGYATQAKSSTPTTVAATSQRTVYGLSLSPFVRKVRVVLFEKNLPYELKEVLPIKILKALNKDIPEDFAKISPLGKIPAYSEGDFSIADSAIIVEYIDRTNPTPSLYPQDPKKRARVDWFHKYADEVVSGVIIQKIFIEKVVKPQVLGENTNEGIVQEALQKELPPILDYLEKEIGDQKWITGDEFTMADIALGSQFVNLKIVGEAIDAKKYPKLAAYIERVHARDSFKKAM